MWITWPRLRRTRLAPSASLRGQVSSLSADENVGGVGRCCVGVTAATADDGVDDVDGDIPRGRGGSRYGGGAHRPPIIINRYLSIGVIWWLAALTNVRYVN